jgi:CO/xanthine dehydrogenase FAD-binding subunit
VVFPSTIQELLQILRDAPDTLIVAGGTDLAGRQSDRKLVFPINVACIARIPELRRTVKTEQFLETGSCTTLTGLLSLSTSIPVLLAETLRLIGNQAIRNIATIGGNLFCADRFQDLWPVLSCMDAQIELKNYSKSYWVNISHLAGRNSSPEIPKNTLLSRVRIPLQQFDFVFARKTGSRAYPSSDTAMFICAASVERNRIESFKLIFAGAKVFRNRDVELSLIGRHFPIPEKERQDIYDEYMARFDALKFFDRRIFSSILEETLSRISER